LVAIIAGANLLRELEKLSVRFQEEVASIKTELKTEVASIKTEFAGVKTEVALFRSDIGTVNYHLTPSSDCKSNNPKFLNLLELLLLPRDQNLSKLAESLAIDLEDGDFQFEWRSNVEATGYSKVLDYLQGLGLIAHIVADDTKLAEGLLYDVVLYSLRTTEIRRPRCRYRLRGRTDIIVLDPDNANVSRSSTVFGVEIKSAGMNDEKGINQALREGFLQLVGLNAANEYRSPPVILSNLVREHYVLYFVREQNSSSGNTYYQLKIVKAKTFGGAVRFVCTSLMKRASVTHDLCRGPWRSWSPSRMIPRLKA
jgi:hypothetical protein